MRALSNNQGLPASQLSSSVIILNGSAKWWRQIHKNGRQQELASWERCA
jgi:hypothetical protein